MATISNGKQVLEAFRQDGKATLLDTKEDVQKLKRIGKYMESVKRESARKQKASKLKNSTKL